LQNHAQVQVKKDDTLEFTTSTLSITSSNELVNATTIALFGSSVSIFDPRSFIVSNVLLNGEYLHPWNTILLDQPESVPYDYMPSDVTLVGNSREVHPVESIRISTVSSSRAVAVNYVSIGQTILQLGTSTLTGSIQVLANETTQTDLTLLQVPTDASVFIANGSITTGDYVVSEIYGLLHAGQRYNASLIIKHEMDVMSGGSVFAAAYLIGSNARLYIHNNASVAGYMYGNGRLAIQGTARIPSGRNLTIYNVITLDGMQGRTLILEDGASLIFNGSEARLILLSNSSISCNKNSGNITFINGAQLSYDNSVTVFPNCTIIYNDATNVVFPSAFNIPNGEQRRVYTPANIEFVGDVFLGRDSSLSLVSPNITFNSRLTAVSPATARRTSVEFGACTGATFRSKIPIPVPLVWKSIDTTGSVDQQCIVNTTRPLIMIYGGLLSSSLTAQVPVDLYFRDPGTLSESNIINTDRSGNNRLRFNGVPRVYGAINVTNWNTELLGAFSMASPYPFTFINSNVTCAPYSPWTSGCGFSGETSRTDWILHSMVLL
jgi:hypothetical protein